MRIADVKTYVVANPPPHKGGAYFVFLKLTTDDNVEGFGEVYGVPFHPDKVTRLIEDVVERYVVGWDPFRIESMWRIVYSSGFSQHPDLSLVGVLSGIDIALWDIRGKELGQPIYKLLGGEVRDRIALYTHPPRPDTPEKAAADALEIVESGHRALKLDPFWEEMADKSTSYLDGQIRPETAAKAVEIIAAIREAVGPEIEVLIDAHGNFNVPTAVYLAQSLAPYGIHWFEEPVPPESYHALKQVRDQVPVRICVGERLHTRFEFLPVFEGNLADFVMPDVTWTGGISELKKISTMAEAYYVPVSPHDASGPINVLAGAHVMMTVPNFYKLETTRYDLSRYDPMIDEPLDVRRGDLYLSDRPGLGVDLKREYLEANELPG